MNATSATDVSPDEAPLYYRAFVESSAPEPVAAALIDRAGAEGVEIRDGDAWVEGESPADEGVVAYFAADTPERRPDIHRTVVGLLDDEQLQGSLTRLEKLEDQNWRETWKEAFESLRLSERVAVGPPWDEAEPPNDGIALSIEPGMAFGTGMHATTRLAAGMVDDRLETTSPETVLDVGCGSGILAIAAARLGADEVVGVDVSDEAIEAARENARANAAPDIDFSTRPVGDLRASFDLVVANIVSSILGRLRAPIFDAVAEGGDVVVSGIRRDENFLDDFVPSGWETVETRTRDEWTSARIARRE